MVIRNERNTIKIESNDYGDVCVVITRYKINDHWHTETDTYVSCSTIEGLYNGVENMPIELTSDQKQELYNAIRAR